MRCCERQVARVGPGRQADPYANADFRQFPQITVGEIRRAAAGRAPWRGFGRRSACMNAAGTHAKRPGRECCSATMCCLPGPGADPQCTARKARRSRPGGWRILLLKCVNLLLDHTNLSRRTDIRARHATDIDCVAQQRSEWHTSCLSQNGLSSVLSTVGMFGSGILKPSVTNVVKELATQVTGSR